LHKSIERFAGKKPIITMTEKGKRIYDPNIRGKRGYLDLNGLLLLIKLLIMERK